MKNMKIQKGMMRRVATSFHYLPIPLLETLGGASTFLAIVVHVISQKYSIATL